MPDAPDLNLESILEKEKLPDLSKIDPDFYDKAARLLIELEAEKTKYPQGTTKSRISVDMLETSKDTVLDILKIRLRKIIRLVEYQSGVAESIPVPESLTHEEKDLYNAFLDVMFKWKDARVNHIYGIKPEKEEPVKETVNQEVSAQPKKKTLRDYTLVRIISDIPTFMGIDNLQYTLAKEDVVTLPAIHANALIAKKAAVKIGE